MSASAEKRFLSGDGSAPSSTEIAKTLHKTAILLTTWTRCGKPTCRCTTGRRHGPYHAMYWREGSRQRRRYVKPDEVEAVQVVLARRRRHRTEERAAFAADLALLQHLDRLCREVDTLAAERESR